MIKEIAVSQAYYAAIYEIIYKEHGSDFQNYFQFLE